MPDNYEYNIVLAFCEINLDFGKIKWGFYGTFGLDRAAAGSFAIGGAWKVSGLHGWTGEGMGIIGKNT